MQHLCLICALSSSVSLKIKCNIGAQECPSTASDKHCKQKQAKLTLTDIKKVCPGFTEQNSRGFAFSETPGRRTPWRISVHWPIYGIGAHGGILVRKSENVAAMPRREARSPLENWVARCSLGECVRCALVSSGLTFPENAKKRIKR